MAKLNESDIINKTIDEAQMDETSVKRVMASFWSVLFRELKAGNTVNLLGKGRVFLRLRKGGDYPVLRFQVSKTLAKQLKQEYDEGNITLEEK